MAVQKILATSGLLTAVAFVGTPALADMTINVGGRIQVDAAYFDDDVTDLDSGTEFRRARLFAEGDIAENWGYKLQLEFATGDALIADGFVSYGLAGGKLILGQSKVPFSLEEVTSSKYITFMERSAVVNTFAPARRVGAMWYKTAGKMHYGAGMFGQNSNLDVDGDEGLGIGGRFTYAPILRDENVLHFGVNASLQEPTDTDANTVRFCARPAAHVTRTCLIDTGDITGVNNTSYLGLEAAYVNGPFSAQAEWIGAGVNRDASAGGDLDFAGYYGFVSWFITGETRPYNGGRFNRVTPKSKRGAWEIAARYQGIDLTHGNITGGEQETITLGVNYYVNRNLRFMFNYSSADVTDGINGDEGPSAFMLRGAIDFK